MRGRFPRVGDRVIGVALGIALGIAVIVLFLFLGSRSTIDEPSISGATTQTATQPATITVKPQPKPSK